MVIRNICLLLFAVIPIAMTACSSDLYHNEVNIKAEEGEKDLIIQLDEIERKDKYSIVRIKHTSGASIPSIMFFVNGICEIGRKRESKYFVNLKEWDDDQHNRMYKIGYTSEEGIDPYDYFGPDIDKSKELFLFLSKDCSPAEMDY